MKDVAASTPELNPFSSSDTAALDSDRGNFLEPLSLEPRDRDLSFLLGRCGMVGSWGICCSIAGVEFSVELREWVLVLSFGFRPRSTIISSGPCTELVAAEEREIADLRFLPMAVVTVLESVLGRVTDPGERDFLLRPEPLDVVALAAAFIAEGVVETSP